MLGGVRQKNLSLLYRSIAEMLRAGVPVTRALDTAASTMSNPTLKRVVGQMRARIESGASLEDSMAGFSKIFPPLHVKLIGIAERSGRVDPVLRELADHTDQLILMRRTIISGLILPVIYIHAAAFILPFPKFFLGGGLTMYLLQSVGLLCLIWAVAIGGIIVVRRALRSEIGATTLDTIIRHIPVLGITWRELDYWRIASSMEMLISAGLGVVAALRQCAAFCRGAPIANALKEAADAAEQGGTISTSLSKSGQFPEEMISLWTTGEESGRLDEMLKNSAAYFADRCQHRMQQLAVWLPKILYVAVLLYLAWQVISFWSGYYGGMMREMD